MKNVALGFAYRPKATLAVLTADVFPDQNRSGENSGAIVKADTAVTQRLGMLGHIPLEPHLVWIFLLHPVFLKHMSY